MLVLNAVRNKIIHRMFACVRENRKYENIYIHALA
jgi:transposase